jgi:hypothetical protein
MKDCIKIEFRTNIGSNYLYDYLWADKCHLEYSGINGERWFFYRGTEVETINNSTFNKPKLVKILGVRRLTKDGLTAAQKLSRRPYLREVMNQSFIDLYLLDIDNYSGLPDDTIAVWSIARAHNSWVIERSSGATLHIFNNEEKTVKAKTFHEALKKLFSSKQIIRIHRRIVTTEIEEVKGV